MTFSWRRLSTLTYDENIPGKVNSITDGVGRATVLAYNADGLLASITAPGCPVVSYAYDGSAENGWRLREVHYGDLEANQYTNVYSPDRKSRIDEVQYGSGGKVKYTYDEFDRVTGVGYDNDETPRFAYEYDSKGRAAFVKDSTDGSTIRTGYDQTDRPNETEQRDGEGNLKYRTLIEYDKKNRVKAFNEATADASFKTEYTYDADNRVTKVRYNSSDTSKVDYVYDKLNRITSRTVTNGASSYATQYAYAPGATAYGENATTPLVSSITQGEGENAMNFAYEYDSRGNIISETRNGLTTTYVYDALGQLVRVNDPHENATWVYAYDRGGNIQNKAKYAYTTEDELGEAIESIPYTYGDANWKDKLTAYNGVPITYDAIGNPLNDGTWTYEWQAGRQLKSMTNAAAGVTIEYVYNYAGLRTKKIKKERGKVVENTMYILNGKQIVGLVKGNDSMHFYYDNQKRITLVEYNGGMYAYVMNKQGDVVGIVNASGKLVAEYRYDAWGHLIGGITSKIADINPFRYRGYVYDNETNMYYVQKRFYSNDHAGFISPDIIGKNTANAYIYTNNNPIMLADYSGYLPEYTDVNVYLELDGVHWEIEIFGVIISHQKNSYKAKDPKDEIDEYVILSITNVPRQVAEMGMDYLLDQCRPDIIDEYKKEQDVYGYFKRNGWLDSKVSVKPWPGKKTYNRKTHPCAAIVVDAFTEMGLSFSGIWGSPYSKLYPVDDDTKGSNYVYSSIFIDAYGYTKSGASYSYDDALYYTARFSWD